MKQERDGGIRCSAWLGDVGSFGFQGKGHELAPIHFAFGFGSLLLGGVRAVEVVKVDGLRLSSISRRGLDVVRAVLGNLLSAVVTNNNIGASERVESFGGAVVSNRNWHI
jgi:hypothetical protein